MMDKRIEERTDPEVLREIGRRLARLRKARDITQAEVAELAGIDRTTVSRAEQGDNPTLLTLLRLLRVYGRVSTLDAFIPEPEVSPMALVRGARGRARG
jgi:transcriptional regulator with XRE-family HTH domain